MTTPAYQYGRTLALHGVKLADGPPTQSPSPEQLPHEEDQEKERRERAIRTSVSQQFNHDNDWFDPSTSMPSPATVNTW